jgi:hypothetical protein
MTPASGIPLPSPATGIPLAAAGLVPVRARAGVEPRGRPSARSLGRRAWQLLLRIRDQELVGRYVLNLMPVVRYRREGPVLGPAARAAAEALGRDGLAQAPLAELVGDDRAFERLEGHAGRLYVQTFGPEGTKRAPTAYGKPYLVELMGARPALAPDDPVLRLALHPQIKGVAEAYAGMRLRVQDVNVWVNLPTSGGARQSQRWHRDAPNDHTIVKCFIYLSPVSRSNGAMTYVVGTHAGADRKRRLPSDWDGIGQRIPDEAVERVFPPERIRAAVGDAGTVLFADTLGLHRGGQATDNERQVVMITYSSNACTRRPQLTAAQGVGRSELAGVRLARR